MLADINALKVPRRVTESHRETRVHSGVAFLVDDRFYRGELRVSTLHVPVQANALRAHAALTWILLTRVDVLWARDVTLRQPVDVVPP